MRDKMLTVLRGVMGVRATAGPGPKVRVDPAQLRSGLLSIGQRVHVIQHVYLAMLAIIFVVAIALVTLYVSEPALLGGIIAATGISVGLVLTRMNRLWKDMAFLEFLVHASDRMDEATLSSVVLRLTVFMSGDKE
jgi:hypothetical protein